MGNGDQKPIYNHESGEPTYLDIQAEVGITKHMGGRSATDRLHKLLHLETAEEVLEVGCGIGEGPVYIAKQYSCRVVGVDVSEKMLSWAGQRARRDGVSDRITLRKADICELPFEDNRFDAVIVESVLAFVEDKMTAIQELVRVTKPGGYVGLNETFWIKEPSAEVMSQSVYIGTAILWESEWRELWSDVPLEARKIETFQVETKQEVQDRIGWVGWRTILPAWGRLIKLLFSEPSAREAVKQQVGTPVEMMNALGYGLFVGRKPE